MTSIAELKKELRKIASKRVDEFIEQNRRIESDYKIIENIRNLEEYKKAKTILAFYPFMNEPVITDIFNDKGKTFYFPKITSDILAVGTGKLTPGKYGIYEPVVTSNISTFDLMIIPGAAFDINMNRLGRGMGYFDKFLNIARGIKAGICYDTQVFATIPNEPHDVKMDIIITEKRIIRKKKGK